MKAFRGIVRGNSAEEMALPRTPAPPHLEQRVEQFAALPVIQAANGDYAHSSALTHVHLKLFFATHMLASRRPHAYQYPLPPTRLDSLTLGADALSAELTRGE